ncbi:MAG: Rpn family recombination-promoting nuclease/putative transposase [Lachnospiraceae bacterium]|nr:Rpn family recombination-promoting nuclease/putative transposase [Lachnospiraceae bacterium]MBD5505162.1 Rpn family recombination-promoting nuclease/putative transposase [Lachnospiraceae bacterium]
MQKETTTKTENQVRKTIQGQKSEGVNGELATPIQKTDTKDHAEDVFHEEYQLNLSDFALFLSVMKVKEAYEDVLSIILDESELQLKEVKVEQVILNRSGKRAIRLDAWAQDVSERQFNMEMQNDTKSDDIRKRSRFYQGLIDTPILKSGKETRYKHLPSTTIIFITQEDIFGKNLAMYTFRERCEEVPELSLDDGTSKIFLNMTSKNGRSELVSLLQYMKHTTLDNENVTVKDERILDLDRIVGEVKQSEEWEAVRMNILEIGMARGEEIGLERGLEKGREEGRLRTLIENVESAMKNFKIDLQQACVGLGISVEEYEKAKQYFLTHKTDCDSL